MEDRETLIENMEYMENVKDFLNEELTNPYHYTQMQSFDDANTTYRVDIPLPLYLQGYIEQNFGKSFDVICITKGEDTCSFILAGDDCQENIHYTKEQYKTFIEMAEKELAKDKSFNLTKDDIIIDDFNFGDCYFEDSYNSNDLVVECPFRFVKEKEEEIINKIGMNKSDSNLIAYVNVYVPKTTGKVEFDNCLYINDEVFYADDDQFKAIHNAFYDHFGSYEEMAKQLTDFFIPKEPILEQQKAEELLRKFKQVEDKVNDLADDLKSKQNGIKGILFDCMKNLYKEKEKIYSELHYDCSYRFDVELDEKLNIYYDGNDVTFRKVNGANLDFEKGLQIFKDNNFTKETIEKAFWNDMTTLIENNLASIEKQHDKLIEKQKETENSTNEFMQTFTKKDTKSNDKGVDR